MTLSDEIRLHLRDGMSPREIADLLGCRSAYVRVIRQRTDPEGNSQLANADVTWRASPEGRKAIKAASRRRMLRYQTDPAFRAAWLERTRKYRRDRYRSDPEFRERHLAANRAWRERRDQKSQSVPVA